MNRKAVLLPILSLLLASSAYGQTLSDRLDHVREQRLRQQETKIDKTNLRTMLGVLLYRDISVKFEDAAVRDVMEYLATLLDLNIIIRYSDDPNADGFGIDPDTPITLEIEQVPALTVLDLVLEQLGGYEEATWQMRQGYLEVGTKDRLSVKAARFVKVYPIDDLLFEAPRFIDAPSLDLVDAYRDAFYPYSVIPGGGGIGGSVGGGGYGGGGGGYPRSAAVTSGKSRAQKAGEIVDFIIDNIEPTAWEENGGTYASIRYLDGALIVRAPDYIQRQIGGYPKPIKPQQAGTGAMPAVGNP